MDVYTFTYSDGYDIPDIHGWNYYLMDDFLWLEAKCLLHLSIGMCYDLWMHVSALIGPGKFHNEWTV